MKIPRPHLRRRTPDVASALRDVADALRAGRSLRAALEESSSHPGSPFASIGSALAAGRPLVASLRAAAGEHGGDAGLACAVCILAVHAEAGGDPLPAVRAMADRLQKQAVARAEARALTTQARLGSRALLLLTPAFLLLVVASDPGGLARLVSAPGPRAAVAGGLALQGLGALWMGAIVRTAAGEPSRWTGIPLARAMRALLAGRGRAGGTEEIAQAADTVAFAVDAGLSPPAALAAVAPYAPGAVGTALRTAARDVSVPAHLALRRALAAAPPEDVPPAAGLRFADAVRASTELGVPLAPALRGLADDLRERASIALAEDIRRASIRVLLPLGVLVLPAFVLACLFPLFVGGLQGIAG